MAPCWVNGRVCDHISSTDRGFCYGDGLFATMASRSDGQIQFLSCHLQRLQQGALRLGFPWQPTAALLSLLAQIAAQFPQHCIKLQLSRAGGGRGYQPPALAEITEVISVSAIPAHYPQWQQQGIRLQTSSVRLGWQPLLAGIKHLNRLEQVLIKSVPLAADRDDWLVLDSRGHLLESATANLFLVFCHPDYTEVKTPALNGAGVSGVMRQQVIMALLAMGINVRCEALPYTLLVQASHVFISNSLLGTVDVTAVDQRCFSLWSERHQLRERLAVQL